MKKKKILETDKNYKLLYLEEISNNYVFTPDNFVKMILILIRINSNIPVIMMGETGCGKTSLIRKLSELLNNGSSERMKTLNIHAGTNDKDIINFIESVNNESRDGKKLWVFLDEINTCKSMGLISELMCKHSYQGTRIKYNIVFIAACNPYRMGKETKEGQIGLSADQAYKEKEKINEKERKDLENKIKNSNKLVYTVNPLPHSLLNFVFDICPRHRKENL